MISYGELFIYGLIILGFYIAYKIEHRNKPSEYHLLRNHLQSITHPNLNIIGFGDFYVSYIYNGISTVEYFNSSTPQRRRLEEINNEDCFSDISHGVMGSRAWRKWK